MWFAQRLYIRPTVINAFGISLLFAYRNMIRYYPTLMDLTSNFFALLTNMQFIHIIIYRSGWSLAWIFLKEMVKRCVNKHSIPFWSCSLKFQLQCFLHRFSHTQTFAHFSLCRLNYFILYQSSFQSEFRNPSGAYSFRQNRKRFNQSILRVLYSFNRKLLP